MTLFWYFMRLLCCGSLVVLRFVHWWGGGDGGISHRFLRCFPKISGRHCADPRLVAHASLNFHVYVFDFRAGVGREGGWGADDVHANAAYMYCSSFCSVQCREGTLMMLMLLMLFCMMLIAYAYAEDNNGDGDSYGNNNDNENVAPCCPCCYVTLKTPPIRKTLVCSRLSRQNLATHPQNQQQEKTKNMVFATRSQKPHQKTRPNYYGKKLRNIVFLTKPHTTLGFQAFDQKTSKNK